MSLSVGRVDWDIAQKLLRDVREKVFVYEWRIPKDVEFDQKDQSAIHILVCDDVTQEPIATGRILPSGEISRIAVIQNHRHSNADKIVFSALLNIARELKLQEVFIHSDLDAVEIFRAHHFNPVGAVYMEAGIPRQRMVFNLDNSQVSIDKYYLSH